MHSLSEKEKRQSESAPKGDEKDLEGSEDLEESEPETELPDFQLNEHIDCRDSVNKWLNAEIIAVRGEEIRVHYTGWSGKYDEWIPKGSDRVLKQWKSGSPFLLNQRLDVKDETGKFLEARIINIKGDKILVHFNNFSSKFDVWIEKTSERIAEVGRFSKAFGAAKTSQKQSGQLDSAGKKSPSEARIHNPQKYAQELFKLGFIIKQMGEDGNCLFRAVSDQLYSTEKFHSEIRAFCMKYIEVELDYFRNFIEGGNSIERLYFYIENKKKDGIWGDDVEIQALSEIYNRPIEIYVYSSKPIRTFHEAKINDNEPIRLSYHGKSHYNSIRRVNEGEKSMIRLKFGELEENAIKIARLRAENRLLPSSMKSDEKCLILSRNEFEIRNMRELEEALEESLKLSEVQEISEIEDKMLELASKQENSEEIEKLLLEQAINLSITESPQKPRSDSSLPESVLKAAQEGFPLDLALKAYCLVGDDLGLIIQYISEVLLS